MTRPWQTLDSIDTSDGLLELRRRGSEDDGDFLIMIAGRVLMNSRAHRSEVALAEYACAPCAAKAGARVLIGGLGMGFTLRAALDHLGEDARVHVSELNPVVLEWCRGPLAAVTQNAAADPRSTISIEDVAKRIRASADEPFDAIAIDLYEGPSARTNEAHPLYGDRALAATRLALVPEGHFAVWSEEPDPRFAQRMERAGFSVETRREGRGGRRHMIYLGRATDRRSDRDATLRPHRESRAPHRRGR